MPKKKSVQSNKTHTQLYSFLFLTLLLVGIATTVFLVQRQQDIRQRAAPESMSLEAELNPFGNQWIDKKNPDPAMIPVALTTGCYRAGSKKGKPTPSPEEIAFWSKSNTGFVFEECAITEANAKPYYQSLTSSLTSKGIKYVGYSTLLQADINQVGVGGFYNGTGPVNGSEDFFLYEPDGTLHRQGPFPILNITNTRFRSYIIPEMVRYMNETGMGGLLIDSGYSANMLRERKILDTDTLVTNTKTPITNWNANYIDFLRDLNAAMDKDGTNRLLFVNVDAHDADFIEGLLPSVDGIMLEDPLGTIDTDFATRATAIAPILDKAASLNKYVLIVVNTNINCTTPGDITCYNEYLQGGRLAGQQKPFHDYYLAGYLNLVRNSKTVLVYYTPTIVGPQFNSEAFFKEWDLKISDVVGPTAEVAPGVFLRKFQNAFVYFNNSNTPYQPTGVTELYAPDGSEISKTVVPAKSGKIFVRQSILTDWNTP